jgi:hypothetical protein
MITWKERIDKAVASWNGEVSFSAEIMNELPLEIKLDRVFKDAGVRNLITNQQVADELLDLILTHDTSDYFDLGSLEEIFANARAAKVALK